MGLVIRDGFPSIPDVLSATGRYCIELLSLDDEIKNIWLELLSCFRRAIQD
jgi:hypothetical protein